jgi:hypothetical protein
MLQATRRALITLGLLGLLCRALVPVGLMPTPVSAGGPFVYCQGGAAGAFLLALAAQQPTAPDHAAHGDSAHVAQAHGDHDASAQQKHAHATHDNQAGSAHEGHATPSHSPGHDDTAGEHLAWEHCSFGTAFAQAALAPPTFDIALLTLEHVRVLRETQSHLATTFARSYWARGPPLPTA